VYPCEVRALVWLVRWETADMSSERYDVEKTVGSGGVSVDEKERDEE
jgi:hypothetical protein